MCGLTLGLLGAVGLILLSTPRERLTVRLYESPESTDRRPLKRLEIRNNSYEELPIVLSSQVLRNAGWQDRQPFDEKFRLLPGRTTLSIDLPNPSDTTPTRL